MAGIELKYLFSNGCSFLSIREKCFNHVGLELANLYGLEPISFGSNGRGNDRVVLTTKLFFYENPERIKDTFVLIGWTNPGREDYISYHPSLGWSLWGESRPLIHAESLSWRTFKYDRKHLPSDYFPSANKIIKHLRETLELQDFFKSQNIKYCMYHALDVKPYGEDIDNKAFDILRQKVDDSKFFNFCGLSHASFVYASNPKLTISDEDNHPSTEGHRLWAEKLKAFIGQI